MTEREPFSAPMYMRAIARRLHMIAGQLETPRVDFGEGGMLTQRRMAELLREIATAIEEESQR